MVKRKQRPDLLQGTLDLLILKTLTLGSCHGWGICQRIELLSEDVLKVNQGSLYPALQRLLRRGWIETHWDVTDLGRRAKFYALTPLGRRQLTREEDSWNRLSAAVERVLRGAEA